MRLAAPITGRWTFGGYPDVVLVAGHRFRRADWKQPYPDVVEQYREDVPRQSMHLMIYTDGHWAIEHVDDDNPDHGRVFEHFFNDHPVGRLLKGAGVIALLVAPALLASRRR